MGILNFSSCTYEVIFVIFNFVVGINFFAYSLPDPTRTSCPLDFQVSPFGNISSCDGGDWGGFLPSNCCGVAFDVYLHALGQTASNSEQIFLDGGDQTKCVTSLKSFDGNVTSCGFERLTRGRGGGGCSQFSVADVASNLGHESKSLENDCTFSSNDEQDWDQVCSNCVRSWEDMKGSSKHSGEVEKTQRDVCRFAVLISLTSKRIADRRWAQSVYRCLGALEKQETNVQKNIHAAIWILLGGLLCIVVLIVVAACMLWKRLTKPNMLPGKAVTPAKELPEIPGGCQRIPVKEIMSATNNLNELNFIGQGTAGKVYKGVLSNGRKIAVKHIVNEENVETFVREVTSLSHVKHPNLVSLLGYCEEEDECFLVYELCPNGNLSEWLFGKDKVLSWIQRLEIAIDCARGLWFLHTYVEGSIIHRDIKPTNILLGTKFEARLSDFGLSKVIDAGQSYVSSEVRGTFGYVDPEYQRNHRVNAAGDVYSFGIVLLQLLSGKRVIILNLKRPMALDKMAKFITKGGNIAEFADPKMNGEYSNEAFELILKLALSCTAQKQQRPSMEQVAIRLENALNMSMSSKTLSPYSKPPIAYSAPPRVRVTIR